MLSLCLFTEVSEDMGSGLFLKPGARLRLCPPILGKGEGKGKSYGSTENGRKEQDLEQKAKPSNAAPQAGSTIAQCSTVATCPRSNKQGAQHASNTTALPHAGRSSQLLSPNIPQSSFFSWPPSPRSLPPWSSIGHHPFAAFWEPPGSTKVSVLPKSLFLSNFHRGWGAEPQAGRPRAVFAAYGVRSVFVLQTNAHSSCSAAAESSSSRIISHLPRKAALHPTHAAWLRARHMFA